MALEGVPGGAWSTSTPIPVKGMEAHTHWSTAAGQHWNTLEEDHRGQVCSISLKPAFRREAAAAPGTGLTLFIQGRGGGVFWRPRLLSRAALATRAAGKTVTYRPFQEPEVPARIWDRASLSQRTFNTETAVPTILYGSASDTGYVHGALTLKQSLLENGVTAPFYALLGDDMDAEARNALQSFGFICRDVRPRKGVGHSSPLASALGRASGPSYSCGR